MTYGTLSPVAPINGLPDSGHGLCIPSTVHSVQSCNTSPVKYPITIKNLTCWWPPTPLIPLQPLHPVRATVLVNLLPIMVDGDSFIPHISTCTNIIIYMCPCGKSTCPVPTPIPCSQLTKEDQGGRGHARTLNATSQTVFAFKKPIARVLDPLGPPCKSVVTSGSPNVLSS